MPARPAKHAHRAAASTGGLLNRLQDQAGKLARKADEPENSDLLVLSDDGDDDELQQEEPAEDAILARASLSLVSDAHCM